jgi:hypothetical protein
MHASALSLFEPRGPSAPQVFEAPVRPVLGSPSRSKAPGRWGALTLIRDGV